MGPFLCLFPKYSVAGFQLSHLLTQIVTYSVSTFACEMQVAIPGLPASEGEFKQRSNEPFSVNRISQLQDPERMEAAGPTSYSLTVHFLMQSVWLVLSLFGLVFCKTFDIAFLAILKRAFNASHQGQNIFKNQGNILKQCQLLITMLHFMPFKIVEYDFEMSLQRKYLSPKNGTVELRIKESRQFSFICNPQPFIK